MANRARAAPSSIAGAEAPPSTALASILFEAAANTSAAQVAPSALDTRDDQDDSKLPAKSSLSATAAVCVSPIGFAYIGHQGSKGT